MESKLQDRSYGLCIWHVGCTEHKNMSTGYVNSATRPYAKEIPNITLEQIDLTLLKGRKWVQRGTQYSGSSRHLVQVVRRNSILCLKLEETGFFLAE